MRLTRFLSVPILLTGLTVLTSTPTPASAATVTRSADVASAFSTRGELVAVAATGAKSAWAIGYAGTALQISPLIVHWNGKQWRRTPNPAPRGSTLAAVAAPAAGIAWVVGATGAGKTLILHWNGKVWKHVPSPSPGKSAGLDGVAGVSANYAWAIGSAYVGSRLQTLILRWNGRTWKRVSSPDPAGAYLSAVTAVSRSSAWAVGLAGNPAVSQTLALRWNGKSWKRVHSPSPADFPSFFRGAAVTAAGLAWAVGCTSCATASGFNTPLIEEWNRSAWKTVTSSGLGAPGGILSGVATISARSAWAVGGTVSGTGVSGTYRTLIAHWNGNNWRRVSSPSPGKDAALNGVAAVSARDAWAVGDSGTANLRTLILHWNGTAWR